MTTTACPSEFPDTTGQLTNFIPYALHVPYRRHSAFYWKTNEGLQDRDKGIMIDYAMRDACRFRHMKYSRRAPYGFRNKKPLPINIYNATGCNPLQNYYAIPDLDRCRRRHVGSIRVTPATQLQWNGLVALTELDIDPEADDEVVLEMACDLLWPLTEKVYVAVNMVCVLNEKHGVKGLVVDV